MENYKISHITEISILIEFGDSVDKQINKNILIFINYLEKYHIEGIKEYIPYYCSVSIVYDPLVISYTSIKSKIENIINNLDFNKKVKRNIVEIPICYDGDFGPDIDYVAKSNNISIRDVINIHSSCNYVVYMIGFTPGFPYLGGLSPKLYTKRKDTPRLKIPKGSVSIGGMQTGIYSEESPGGWQIIGRTPLDLFDINMKSKTLLKCGDIVKFIPITEKEYYNWEKKSEHQNN